MVKEGLGGRFGPLPGMSAVSAMPHVSTTLMLICRTRGLTLSVMSQCGSGSCLIPRDVRGTEIFCRKSRCIMDLAERWASETQCRQEVSAQVKHHPAMAIWTKRDQAWWSKSSVKQEREEPRSIQVIRGGNDLMTAPALTLVVCQQVSRRVRSRMMMRRSGNAQICSSQRCKPLMVSQASGGPSSFSFERWLKLVSGAIGRNQTHCWRVPEAKPLLTFRASQSHAEATTKHFWGPFH